MSKQYDLTTFAGRLAAIAAGEELAFNTYDSGATLRLAGHYILVTDDDGDTIQERIDDALDYGPGTWSLAPKPERTVTISESKLRHAMHLCGWRIKDSEFNEIVQHLGLGEES